MASGTQVREFLVEYPDINELTAAFAADLRKGRAFARGAAGVAERERCALRLVHPITGKTLRLEAEAVWIQVDGPHAGVGVALQRTDDGWLGRLQDFVEEGTAARASEPGELAELEEIPPSAGEFGSLPEGIVELERDAELDGNAEVRRNAESALSSRFYRNAEQEGTELDGLVERGSLSQPAVRSQPPAKSQRYSSIAPELIEDPSSVPPPLSEAPPESEPTSRSMRRSSEPPPLPDAEWSESDLPPDPFSVASGDVTAVLAALDSVDHPHTQPPVAGQSTTPPEPELEVEDDDEERDPEWQLKSPAEREAAETQRKSIYDRVRSLAPQHAQRLARTGGLTERVALERTYAGVVWEGLLLNPSVTPPEVARIAKKGSLPKPVLNLIVSNAAWTNVPEIQRALLSNPRMSTAAITRVLRQTSAADLRKIAKGTAYSHGVRSAAQKLIKND